jgi:hypothetical protein
MIMELRLPLIVLVLATVLGGVMVTASWYIEDAKTQRYQQVQNRFRAAQMALTNIRQEETDLVTYRNRFEALSARGIYGQEQRLNWVEYMTNLTTVGHLKSLNYEIASQRPVSVTALPQANSIEVLASRIQLKMGFVHEEDLVHTVEDLRQSRAGFYRVEGCTVKRKEGVLAPTFGENVVADCKLQWITMRLRNK